MTTLMAKTRKASGQHQLQQRVEQLERQAGTFSRLIDLERQQRYDLTKVVAEQAARIQRLEDADRKPEPVKA